MGIYKVSQYINRGYDTYDSMVVIASSEWVARRIHPYDEVVEWNEEKDCWGYRNAKTFSSRTDWARPEEVEVEYLGKFENTTGYESRYAGNRVVVASFNAG